MAQKLEKAQITALAGSAESSGPIDVLFPISGPRIESHNLYKTEIRQMLFRHTQVLVRSRRSSLRHLKTRIERTRETRRFREVRLLRERSELRVKQERSSRSETVRTDVKYRQPQFRLEKRIQPVEVVYQKRQEVLPPQIVEPSVRTPPPSQAVDISKLSEDVMRRLNKQMFIERERRGLL